MSAFQIDMDYEPEIVWLRDPLQYTYLREYAHWTTKPRGRIAPNLVQMAFIVGYVQYRRSASYRPVYRRRFWWLKKHDRDLDNKGVYRYGFGPYEAVVPASIAINQKSERWYPPKNEIEARIAEIEKTRAKRVI
jgi:Family of unknown function (DUF6009)